ncbi:MAG: ATP-grasp domain-containing protein [Candidatus Bipolaricaulota bacterium]|nr:MAG: ATP-grasp domain-containing protein [Candidatus Bipolaricaulota bacterium]
MTADPRTSSETGRRSGAGGPLPAILLGSHIAAYGAIRSLARRRIPVHGVAEERGIAGRSHYVRSFLRLPPEDDAFIERLNAWAERTVDAKAVVLVAGSDAYLDVLADGRDRLLPGLRVVGSGRPAIDWFRAKHRTVELAVEAGVGVPQTRLATSRSALERLVAANDLPPFPVIAKCEHSQRLLRSHGVKGVVCRSTDELLAAHDRYAGFYGGMLLQEFVPGPERGQVNVLAVVSAGGAVTALFVNEKLRTSREFLSCTLMRSSRSAEAAEATLRLIRAARFHGAVNAEFKRDPRDGTLKLLEVNARLTVSNSHALKCGVDLVHAAYRSALGEEDPPSSDDRRGPPEGVLWWYPVGDAVGILRSLGRGDVHPVRWVGESIGRRMIVAPWSIRDPWPGMWSVLRAPVAIARRRSRE